MAERRAWRPRRLLEGAFAAAVGAGLLWCAWGYWYDRRMPERLERIHLGMDRKAAEAILGRPDWEGTCGARIASLPREGCARELGYASPFALIVPKHYLVQLDRGGRVIEAEIIAGR
ncbi:MAG TPA: hypothetical protein VD846_03330 [Allosphingosinicella sp.]|nr:hypothetical protein [Allosphingosinicella sp.]